MKVLECKVGQSTMLTHANLVMLKALETYIDVLEIRSRISLNLNATLFCPKKLLNVSKDNAKKKISPKSTTTNENQHRK